MKAGRHRQVPCGPRGVRVDEGLAELLGLLWSSGVRTTMSCQEDTPGVSWVMFPSPDELAKFLNLVLRPGGSLYNQSRRWEYTLVPWNRSIRQNGRAGEPSDFRFRASVRFPAASVPEIVRALRGKCS